METESNGATRKRGPSTPECVSPDTVWAYLKTRFPAHTEKRVARELDVPHRTVEGWRRRLPSAKHVLLLIQLWPDFVEFLRLPTEEYEARTTAMEAEIAEIKKRITGLEARKDHGTETYEE